MIVKNGGAARWKDLRVAGVAQREIGRAVAESRIVRQRRGVYTLAERSLKSVALELGGALCHLSAVEAHNLGVLVPNRICHVAVSASASRRRAVPRGVQLHYLDLDAEEIATGVTSRLRTVLDCLRICTLPQALAIADRHLREGRLTKEELVAAAATLRGPGCRQARRAADAATSCAASEMESALRGTLLEAGLTCFEPQFVVVVNGIKLATTDLGDPVTKVLIEADSFSWHGNRLALSKDAKRYDDLTAAGFVVLRFAWEHIVYEPAWLVDVVRAALAQCG